MTRTAAVLALVCLEATANAADTYHLAYVRSCDSVATPALAGDFVFACSGRFAAADGRYLGPAPDNIVATLPHGLLIERSYGAGGLIVHRPQRDPLTVPGGFIEALAVSPS